MRNRLALLLFVAAAVLVVALLSGVQKSRLFRFDPKAPPAKTVAGYSPAASLPAANSVTASTVLVQPRYTGRDAQGRLWEITASQARQLGSLQGNLVELDHVSATWIDPSRTLPFTFAAQKGEFQQASNTLVLKNDVVVTGQGYTLTAPQLTTSIASRTATGNQGVTFVGPAGRYNAAITADNFAVDQKTGRVTLTGRVKARLQPK